jgi:hypothetical protein
MLQRYAVNRKALVVAALLIVGAGLALSWSWLVAAGVAPLILALAPCAAMCALGMCMSRMSGKSSCRDKSSVKPATETCDPGKGVQ